VTLSVLHGPTLCKCCIYAIITDAELALRQADEDDKNDDVDDDNCSFAMRLNLLFNLKNVFVYMLNSRWPYLITLSYCFVVFFGHTNCEIFYFKCSWNKYLFCYITVFVLFKSIAIFE
jgi:hypothetical protein